MGDKRIRKKKYELAVVGSASAVPGPIERRELCQKNPDKFVWVEKTEACIPINPCISGNKDIASAYCLLAEDRPLYSTGEKLDYIIKYFTKHSLQDTVEKISSLENRFVAVKTTGGYYFVARVSTPDTSFTDEPIHGYITDAIAAINIHKWTMTMNFNSRDAKISVNNAEVFCQEIADLASLLADTIITAHTSDASLCVLKW